MVNYKLLLIFFFLVHVALAQNPVAISPTQFSIDQSLTITYDATLGNAALAGYTGDVYLYSGVLTTNSTNTSDWKYVVPSDWNNYSVSSKMTRVAANLYQKTLIPRSYYSIPANETVTALVMIFRNNGSSLIGRTVDNQDIVVWMPASQLGNYVSHTWQSGILTILTTSGYKIEIQPFTEEIIKVKLLKPGQITEEISMPVILTPGNVEATVNFQDQQLDLVIGNKTIRITKTAVHLEYLKNNTLISSESGGFSYNGTQKGIGISLTQDEQIYGFGSQGIPQNRRGYKIFLYNQAKYGYGLSGDTKELNIAIPFFSSSKYYGIYFDNTYPGTVDIGLADNALLSYSVPKGELGYYFMYGDSYSQILQNYTLLTGRQPLPPRWALGYLQSKFGYQSETEARNIVNQIRTAGFPLDGLILDLYWFGQPADMGDLAWDTPHWINHTDMISDFSQMGIQTILITEPYFTTSSSNYSSAVSQNLMTPDSTTSNPYVINGFWAGNAGLLDLTKPTAKNWMWNFYKSRIDEGVGGWWCDLGEPENHPLIMKHFGGEALKVHNFYSLHWAQMIHDKYAEIYPEKRVFNLIRSGYAGMQRYSTFPWSGDISRSFNGLRLQVPIMLGMGMSGIGYMHSDAGGFTGGGQNAELYTRWLQFSTFAPVFRPHGSGIPTEPTGFDPITQQIVRNFIRLRYQLLPYNYSLAFENSLYGTPLARPMNFDTTTSATINLNDQYLWGPDILVAPVLAAGQTQRLVMLPPGKWVDFWTEQEKTGNQPVTASFTRERIPIYIKSGCFITMTKVYSSTEFYTSDSLIVHYYPSENQSADSIFNDDGQNPQSLATSQFEIIKFRATPEDQECMVNMTSTGSYNGKPSLRSMEFALHRQAQNAELWIDSTIVPVYSLNTSYDTAHLGCRYDALKQTWWLKFNWQNQPFSFNIKKGLINIHESPLTLARIYPNPVKDIMNLEWSVQAGIHPVVIITDILGHEITQIELPESDCQKLVDVSSLPKGVYLIRFETTCGSQVIKMVKE